MKISTQQPEENGVLIELVSSRGRAHAFRPAGWLCRRILCIDQSINPSVYFAADHAAEKTQFKTLKTHHTRDILYIEIII